MSAGPMPTWRRRRLGARFARVFGDGFEAVMAELFGQVLLGDFVTAHQLWRLEQQPDDEDRAQGKHDRPEHQGEVQSGGLLDVSVAGRYPDDGDDHSEDQEQRSGEGTDVEEL